MHSARRTETVTSDWVHALKAVGMVGSSIVEKHLDTGSVPPSLLQPSFSPPRPPSPPPHDLDGLLGPDLSGKADKDARKYIPAHFPSFPSKHTWKATPVYTSRESDPRKIREKATEEGILAEQSLRKLMAAQKAGLQGNKARKQRRSKRMKKSDALWQDAMNDLQADEEEREEIERRRPQFSFDDEIDDVDEGWNNENETRPKPRPEKKKKSNLPEGVHVNYDQKYWRKSARGF
jgi:transcription initiation factor TFIID subunit 8